MTTAAATTPAVQSATTTGNGSLVGLRWAVRSALALGVSVSVIANVLHAADHPISQAIAAWPPVALLVTVELVSRVPIHRRLLAAIRITATVAIAVIAAWISYHHMAGVAARYGETSSAARLLPVSVDGLIVVASICLIELTSRITSSPQLTVARPTVAQLAGAQPTVAQPEALQPTSLLAIRHPPSADMRRPGRQHSATQQPGRLPVRDSAADMAAADGAIADAEAVDDRRPRRTVSGSTMSRSAGGSGRRDVTTSAVARHTDARAGGRPENRVSGAGPSRSRSALVSTSPTRPGPADTATSSDADAGVAGTVRVGASLPTARSVGPQPTDSGPIGSSPPQPAGVDGYRPVSTDDAMMYQIWRNAVANGRTPSGVELARAVGRADDRSGQGRRAIRRYRDAETPTGLASPSQEA
jgi:hypothetical protein